MDFFKIFGPTFIPGEQFCFDTIGSPDFVTFGCEFALLVIFGDFASVMRFCTQDITKNHENFLQNFEIFVLF